MQFRKATIGFLPAALALLSACDTIPASAAPPLDRSSALICPAKDLQYLVGQSRSVLQTMRFGTEIRFEEPGQMYSQEYKASRTRIVIGEDGKIRQVLCG